MEESYLSLLSLSALTLPALNQSERQLEVHPTGNSGITSVSGSFNGIDQALTIFKNPLDLSMFRFHRH